MEIAWSHVMQFGTVGGVFQFQFRKPPEWAWSRDRRALLSKSVYLSDPPVYARPFRVFQIFVRLLQVCAELSSLIKFHNLCRMAS